MTKAILLVAAFFGITTAGASPVDQLDSEISNLSSKTAALETDVPAAFQRLKDETNLSKSILLVGNIIQAQAGNTVSMDITLIPGAFQPTSLQASITAPPGFTLVSITAGPAATAALKQVVFSSGTFIIFGINQNVINEGVVATAEFTIAPSISTGPHSVALLNPVVSDASGHALVVSAVSGTVEVQ